jgi:hypothetical protein
MRSDQRELLARCVCEASGDIESRAEVVQSMRVGIFSGFAVLGSQYRDQSGELHWYIALLSRDGPNLKIRHVLRGEVPEGLAQDECDATVEAICLWEAHPASRRTSPALASV